MHGKSIQGWAACAPTDADLMNRLLATVKNDILSVQTTAMELLGRLKDQRSIPVLEEASRTSGDVDVRKAAKDAFEEVGRVEQ